MPQWSSKSIPPFYTKHLPTFFLYKMGRIFRKDIYLVRTYMV